MTLAPQVRDAATAVDPSLRLVNVQRANEANNDVLWVMGLWLRITVVLSSVALVLSLAGIYAVLSFTVARRTREIGVRVALGASRRRVLVMIIRDVVKLVLPGTIVGVVLTIVLNRLNAENMGISLSNAEPIAYVVGPAIAVLVAVLASLAHARRAASVQPMVAMRSI